MLDTVFAKRLTYNLEAQHALTHLKNPAHIAGLLWLLFCFIPTALNQILFKGRESLCL